MVIARDTKTLLWTDDSLQAQAAAQIFGSRRVWTQIVLVVLVERGLLAAEEYIKAVAQILGFRYLSTIFNAQVMLEAVRQAKFRRDTTPLKQAIEVFSSEQGVAQGLFRMFGEFLILLHVEACSSAQRCLVVSAFLDSLWRNPNAHTFVLSLRQASARLFGLNVLGQTEFDACFDRWHRSVACGGIWRRYFAVICRMGDRSSTLSDHQAVSCCFNDSVETM